MDEEASVGLGTGVLTTASRHSSATDDYGTPQYIVEDARQVMGRIALDPASSAEHNARFVNADRIFTREDDGFRRPWYALSVFLNPPGGSSDDQQRTVKPRCRATGSCGLPPGHTHEGVASNQKKWWAKLAREYARGHVDQAVFVCFSVELLQSSQSGESRSFLTPLDFSICYPRQRVRYYRDGKKTGAPPHASCIVYLPPLPLPPRRAKYIESDWDSTRIHIERFRNVFSKHGRVVVPAP